MNDERLLSFRNPWFAWSVGSVAAIGAAAVLVGFVWLPSVHADVSAGGLWATICRAAGVPSRWYGGDVSAVTRTPSAVVTTASSFTSVDAAEAGRGATLAQQCGMCHGARGISEASFPSLAGQFPEVVYKQLRDYQDGHRQSAVMEALSKGLSDADMHALAVFYASLPRQTLSAMGQGRAVVPPLVRVGDPLRNIAPCISCHGGVDRKAGSPWLEGAPAAYLRTQLDNFANGTRANDINGQMRNVARQLDAAERAGIAEFYAAQPEAPVANETGKAPTR